MRRFDPIDILFIVLISSYLIAFFAIVLFFVRKYLKEKSIFNKPIKEMKIPTIEEFNKNKSKNKPKASKKNVAKKKGPNNSKKSTYIRSKNTKKQSSTRNTTKKKNNKKKNGKKH